MRPLRSSEGRRGFWLGAGSGGGLIGLAAALFLFAHPAAVSGVVFRPRWSMPHTDALANVA